MGHWCMFTEMNKKGQSVNQLLLVCNEGWACPTESFGQAVFEFVTLSAARTDL